MSPLHIICGGQLTNEAMEPSNLLRHLETKHLHWQTSSLKSILKENEHVARVVQLLRR